MLKELKLTSQKGDATLVMRPHVRAGWDGQSVVHMSISTRGGHYIGAGLALEDVKALVKPGAGVRTTLFSQEVYVGSSLATAGGTGGKSYTLFRYPEPWAKTRQTIIAWLNAAITEFDTKKEPDVAITPTISTSYKITDSDGDSVEFFPTPAGGVRMLFKRRSFNPREATVTLDVTRSNALVKALRAARTYEYTTIRPGGGRTLICGHGWINGPGISITTSEDEQTIAADFVEKSMGLSKAEPEAVVKDEPKFKVGDRVKIVAPAKGLRHHSEVGQTGAVTAISKFGGFDVRPDRGTTLIYAPEALEPVKDEPKFKVGDRVKIVGNPTNLGREPEVGREGTVTGVRDSYLGCGDQFSVKPERGTTWWYSASALEKIEESKPTSAPTPVKTAVPVFGPVGVVALSDAEAIQKAADALSSAFTWCATTEGHDFWRAIHNRLLAMADAARTPSRRPAADYKSACPAGYETLAMAMLRRGKPDDATVSLGTRVSRAAGARGIDRVWVVAPLVAAGETDKVRAYPTAALNAILADLGIA